LIQYSRDAAAGAETLKVLYSKAVLGVSSEWRSDLSPLSRAKLAAQADAPILLVHGKDEPMVAIAQSQETAPVLRDAGKPVEFITLPNANHCLQREDWRLAMGKAALEFVLTSDPPDPEPTPVSAPAQ
jgi:dipeptidyl aminopeptidase/acylaminoacyl peptidase